jgi:hypothetical protein
MKTRTTYIDLINQFWTQSKECAFNPSDAVLYFFLLNTCNALHWKQPFGQSDRFLSLSLGFSINTIRGAKNRLKQRGLIDFKAPEKNGKGIEGQTKYVILSVSNFDIVPDTDADTDADRDTDRDTDNNIRQDKRRKDKKEKVKKRKSFKEFTEQDFIEELKLHSEKYSKEMLKDFFIYWTEPNEKGKMKFQLQKTWSTAGRLSTWSRNDFNGNSGSKPKETKQSGGHIARDGTRIMMF